jgi:VacB/RNase II family 3'-5' exoribonuclease
MMVPRDEQRSYLRDLARQAMLERGFLPDFAPDAVAEVAAIPGPAQPVGQVADLRDLLWCSIDNDDSRDLDQLSVAETGPEGQTRLLVAVADVDSLVPAGGPVDGHAQGNTTTLYMPGSAFGMLPERLSYDLTSLNPGADRLAVVMDMTVDADGNLQDGGQVYRALVHNHAQLAYDAVAAWLEGAAAPPAALAAVPGLAENVRWQDATAQRLRRQRDRCGALEFETGEARAVFEGEQLVDLVTVTPNRSRKLIEDLMIAANETVARFLATHGYPVLRRVVRTPARWPRLVQVARELGHDLPGRPDSRALQAFLDARRAADPLRFPDLGLTVVKLLGSGEYVAEFPGQEVPGHFGLAVRDYTHSTAPNRRYPDVITQRLVKAALDDRPPPYGRDELLALAAHCTEREDEAQKVERRLGKSAAAMLFTTMPHGRFDAFVTGVTNSGTWVRVLDPPAEGRLAGGDHLDVGDRLCVALLSTDVDQGYIDFERC